MPSSPTSEHPHASAGTTEAGTSTLFMAAFGQSKNAMALVDADRRFVDVNGAFVHLLGYERNAIIGLRVARLIDGGPVMSPSEWRAALAEGRHAGNATLLCALGDRVAVQWASTTEVVTGRQLHARRRVEHLTLGSALSPKHADR